MVGDFKLEFIVRLVKVSTFIPKAINQSGFHFIT